MKKILCLYALIALCVGCNRRILKIPGNDPFTEPVTGLYFAEDICSLSKLGTTIYPDKRAGISFGYQSRDQITLTVYLFDGGIEHIENGAESKETKRFFSDAIEQLLMLQKMGEYDNVNILNQEVRSCKIKNVETTYRYADCRFTADGLVRNSVVFLTGYHNRFLKIRYTYPAELESNAQSAWDCILDYLTKDNNAFDFLSLQNIMLSSSNDYKNSEPTVKMCSDYILSSPVSPVDINRKFAVQFLVKWMGGTPDYKFSMRSFLIGIEQQNSDLLGVYLASYIKSTFEDSAAPDTAKEIGAIRNFLNYCYDDKNGVENNEALEKLNGLYQRQSPDELLK